MDNSGRRIQWGVVPPWFLVREPSVVTYVDKRKYQNCLDYVDENVFQARYFSLGSVNSASEVSLELLVGSQNCRR